MARWYLPKNKEAWVMFDTANGDPGSKRYLWWFDTKSEALAYKRWVRETYPDGVRLTKPYKVRIYD